MREFVTIPTCLIHELDPDKLYAIVDLLSTADENGRIKMSTTELMERWKWGNTKVRNIINYLIEKGICMQEENSQTNKQTNKKQTSRQTRVLLVNTGFFALSQTKAQTRNKQADKQAIGKENATEKQMISNVKNGTIGTKKGVEMVIDSWDKLSESGIEKITKENITNFQYYSIVALAKKYGISDILDTIEKVRSSEFLTGKTGSGWAISLNWFLKEENYEKIRAGNYNQKYISRAERMLDSHYKMIDEWIMEKEIEYDS